MPITIILDNLPAGTAESSGRDEEVINVISQEFLSSEDGERLIERLEGVSNLLFSKIPVDQRPNPSQIDHLLAVVRKDKTATLYINELDFQIRITPKKKIEVGQSVYTNEIADIDSIRFPGVEITDDAGIYFIFSVGWRKGLFYDLTPLRPNSDGLRAYNLNYQLGQLYAYLTFQDLLKISDEVWGKMFVQEWFPFISLSPVLSKEMVKQAEAGWEIDDLLPKIAGEVKESLNDWLEKWSQNSLYKSHSALLGKAVERFLKSDHQSAISILYPRIEGILQNYYRLHGSEKPSQKRLAETAVRANISEEKPKLPLLPEKFQRYLLEVYFRNFDPDQPEGVSRNTVSHGLAPVEAFSEKASVIGFLILEHLSYFFSESRNSD